MKFDIIATPSDEEAIKQEVASLVEDFKSSDDNQEFLSENDADTNLNDAFQFKNQINVSHSDNILNTTIGDVYGPYKDKGFFKLSKVIEISQMPDSVKASHILIPHVGAQRVAQDVTRTENEAKKLADSILNVVKKSNRKFDDLAKQFSSDKSNADKGGDLNWFTYNRMTPKFRDFTFTNKKGAIDVVQTPFGFHIIKIDDQKNNQRVVKLATFGRKIIPSVATENEVFQKAELFALELSKDKKFFEVAKDNNYVTKQAVGLKVLDENVPGLGNQRQIVRWAFDKDRALSDFERFDLDGSHVVAFLTGKFKKGLMSAAKATNAIRPILMNEKKASIIIGNMDANSIDELAKNNNVTLNIANGLNLNSPVISGVGFCTKGGWSNV